MCDCKAGYTRRMSDEAQVYHLPLSLHTPADLSAEELKRAGVTVLGEHVIYGVRWLLMECGVCGWVWGIHHWPENRQAVLDQRDLNPYWMCPYDRRRK